MSSYTPPSTSLYSTALETSRFQKQTHITSWATSLVARRWLVLAAAVFLISVPIFVQAPLVRALPWLGLASTAGWLGVSGWLWMRPQTRLWGDLLFGFSWTWFTGSIYWGWFRWEPFLHLPIEAIGLPFAVFCLLRQQGKVGNWFYLGSLFGTVLTDLYFYLMNLIPYWRQLMQVEPGLAKPILQAAVSEMQTPRGLGFAAIMVTILLVVGLLPLRSSQLHWWAFGGAVLSTLLVDGLFWLAATTA